MKPSIELIQNWFGYDPELGVLTRKLKSRSDLSDIVYPKDKRVYLLGTRYPYTHIIWVVVYGKWPACLIDHKDHDQMNNRLDNLREATESQNQHNKRMFNSCKGVSFDKSTNRAKPFVARIMFERKSIFLGTFASWEEAAQAYREAALKYHGEFACVE